MNRFATTFTAAALEDGEHLGEGVGDEVVGIAGACQLSGQPACGVDVAREQLSVGVDIPAPNGRDQLGVTGAVNA